MNLFVMICQMDSRIAGLIIMISALIFVESDKIVGMTDKDKNLEESCAPVNTPTTCDQFFFGLSFPRMKGNQSGLVKLCQTQQHDGYVGPAVFATLFNVLDRIPVYSATVHTLYPNSSGYSRPDPRYWHRVALDICNLDLNNLPDFPLSSRLGSAGSGNVACGKFQAIERDYKGNEELLGVDRGHLNPNAINCQDQENQVATFTLTNAAPQFSKFNEVAWRQYECMTELLLINQVPMERVYIVTGTLGQAKDKNNNPIWMNSGAAEKNPVKVPGYYWKAVCYPGNPWNKIDPWGYAVLHANSNSSEYSAPSNIMKLRDFSNMYFEDDLFDPVCLDATLGPIQSYFENWVKLIDTNCNDIGLTCSQ